MSGIRINKLCHQLNIGKKELIAFLSSKGIMASSNPNFKVPESAIPLLQKEYGYIENTETIARTLEENLPFECVPLETKTKPTKSKILPDSPFRIGTSGKFKLLIKNIEEKLGDYEYLLVDADEKEYKAIAESLFSVGEILRCIVTFKVEKAKLVVESVSVCKKQDFASPIPVPQKVTSNIDKLFSDLLSDPNSKSTSKSKSKLKSKTTKPKTTSITYPTVNSKTTNLGNPEESLISGEYNLRVYERVRGKMLVGANYRYLLEDADGVSYFALSNQFFEIGSILACNVKVNGKIVIKEVSILYKAKSSPKRKKTDGNYKGAGKRSKRNTGYTQYDWAGTPYTGGIHIIYTRM